MAMQRRVIFEVETVMGDDPMELTFHSAKRGGSLWAEAHDRVATWIKEAETGDRVYRITLVQNDEQPR